MATKKASKVSSKKASKKSSTKSSSSKSAAKKGAKRAKAQDDGVCLLNYLPSSYPVPIQTATGQTPAQAILNTAALPGGQTVYCNQIVIAVPIGTDAGDLFQQTPVASLNTGKWTISSMEVRKGRDLGIVDNEDGDYATFTFDCRDPGDYLINYNLVFGLSGPVAPIASPCTLLVMENSGTTNDPGKFTTKNCSYTITTSTPQFYLQNFTAYATGSPTVPATEFANGAEINLSWQSNGTFFQLYEKKQSKPIYAGTQTTFKLTGGVKSDTTFVLVAMVSGNPSGDQPQAGYQPIYLYDALTVTISNPDLTPNSSNIAGNGTVGGTLTVKGSTTLTNTNVGGTLGVTGTSTLGNASVGGTLGVSGTTTLANTSVGGTLGVTGNATLASATVNGLLNAGGAATLSGGLTATASAISMLTGAQGVSSGQTYSARTDGLVLGLVSAPSDAGKLCICWIWGNNSDGVGAYTVGGNTGAFNSDWHKTSYSNNQSFILPVRNGNTWSVGYKQSPNNQASAGVAFYWIPLGNAAGGKTIEAVSDEPLPVTLHITNRRPLPQDEKVNELVEVIEAISGKSIERQLKRRLLSVLKRLQVEDFVEEDFEING